jgi:ABC-type branched-subunit amino acid transport system substrate-binding protein
MARVVSGALVAFLILTACVGEARRPPPDFTVPTTAPAPAVGRPAAMSTTTTTTTIPATITTVAAPTTTTLPREPVRVLEAGPNVPVLVGGLLPFSGDAGALGAAQADAIQLAADTFGEIAGHDVLLAPFEDSRCSVDGGRAASRAIAATGALVGSSPIVGIIGPGCDAAAIEAVPLLVGEGFALVSPSVGDADFTVGLDGSPGSLWLPGLFTLDEFAYAEAVTAARFVVRELDASRPAVLTLADDEASELSGRFFVETLEDLGVTAVAEIVAEEDDFDDELEDLLDEEPDVVFIAIGSEEAGTAIRSMADVEEYDEVARVVLGDALLDDDVDLDDADGVFFVMADSWAEGRDVTGVSYRDVRAEYERLYGREPSLDAARAYDATMLLLTAVAAAAEDREGTLVIDRQAVVDALFDADQPGFSGRLRCGEFGDCLEVRVRVLESTGDLSGTLANEVWVDD